MIKEVLFDADGVVVKSRGQFFSQRLAQRQGLTPEEVLPFFKGDYQLCAIGKANLREVLPQYFAKWKWNGTIDELLQFWFEAERDLDEEVMTIINDLRKRGIRVGLATDNEELRGKYLLEEVGLADKFDDVFISCRMGVKKSNPDFFTQVIKSTGFEPREIQYWDDDQKNVDIAKKLGIDAVLFTDAAKIREKLF